MEGIRRERDQSAAMSTETSAPFAANPRVSARFPAKIDAGTRSRCTVAVVGTALWFGDKSNPDFWLGWEPSEEELGWLEDMATEHGGFEGCRMPTVELDAAPQICIRFYQDEVRIDCGAHPEFWIVWLPGSATVAALREARKVAA
jgi:hypothetical protein